MINEFQQIIQKHGLEHEFEIDVRKEDLKYGARFTQYVLIFQAIIFSGFTFLSIIVLVLSGFLVLNIRKYIIYATSDLESTKIKLLYGLSILAILADFSDLALSYKSEKLLQLMISESKIKQKFLYFSVVMLIIRKICLITIFFSLKKIRELLLSSENRPNRVFDSPITQRIS